MRHSAGHRMALGGLGVFCGTVLLEHLLQPHLNPLRHEVSEYANGDPGWLMVVGFLSWSASLAASAAVAAGSPPSRGRSLVARLRVVALALAAVGILVTACFATQTSAGLLPHGVRLGLGGRLHDLGSGLATCAIVGSLVASLLSGEGTRRYRRRARAILMVAVASDVALLVAAPQLGGGRQRILLACAALWQMLALHQWMSNPQPG